ncbi:nickel/cobalt transporter [Bartonella tamiae]|uniref:Nickel/cobalt efflux system n=1 Tax=Bartonella tamiae Th239 TaxID=1094558 RepID=J1K0L1_9HYPH|nr:nickel/cobalt transporter [Bartonella tamiae]EJF90565.1 hypothetical protein ME5_00966 [Bartonella tamiae Th239]EJF94057.1 hypothetical protein MEG_00915 [Bartonella tamiae Th307]
MRLKFWFSIFTWASIFSLLCIINVNSQSPLGIGVSEPVLSHNGFWSKLTLQLSVWQQQFERSISRFLIGMHDSPENALKLLGFSFIYGILHAVGPGHGKIVISSYLLAENESLKRGIILSFLSSVLQAISAIIIVGLVFFMLPARLTKATEWATKASFALIMLLGLGLLIKKTKQLIKKRNLYRFIAPQKSQIHRLFENEAINVTPQEGSYSSALTEKNTSTLLGICDMCGNSHILSAEFVKKPLKWKTALLAIFSVGIRPCTGAIFVMSFAMINHLTWIGSFSVLAMSLGTFITVSCLAGIAVKTKTFASKLNIHAEKLSRFVSVLEWLFALAIFLIGLMFFIR